MGNSYYYKERTTMDKLPIIILISIGALLLIVLAFFLFKNFTGKEKFDIENNLLTVGKEYYNSNQNVIPKEPGECATVSLETLMAKGLIDKVENYNSCNKYNTKVKVCKLESNKYHYVPLLDCGSINTEKSFSSWQVGTEKDLIENKSDVEFYFLGYKKIKNDYTEETKENWEDEIKNDNYTVISKTTYYRYRDKQWQWQETKNKYYTNNDVGNVLAYYATSPSNDYPNSDSQTTAYKWYIQKVVSTEPVKMYICKNPNGTSTSYKNKPCSETIGTTETVKEIYTCGIQKQDSLGQVTYLEVPAGSKCDCSSEAYGKNCATKNVYYPSNQEVANRETVYYANSPINGAIKDVSTRLNVSRYYKEETTTTTQYYSSSPSNTAIKVGNGRWGAWSNYNTSKPKEYNTREIESRTKIKYKLNADADTDWEKVSNEYLSLENLLNKFKTSGYDVKSLTEVKNNQELKYEIQLKYRNRNN